MLEGANIFEKKIIKNDLTEWCQSYHQNARNDDNKGRTVTKMRPGVDYTKAKS